MASGSVWVTGDVITATRMNQKTVLVDVGTALNSATKAAGMFLYATDNSNVNYVQDNLYQVKADGSTIFNITAGLGVVPTLQVADVYDTTIGDYTTPTTATASSPIAIVDNNNNGLTSAGFNGSVWVWKFTGLTVGESISKVGVFVNIVHGNIRVKIYKDDGAGGGPSTLLGESSSTAAVSGWNDIACSATVPASGNVWAGFECDDALLNVNYKTVASTDTVAHTYGAGPSPFGSIGTTTTSPEFRLTLLPATSALAAVDGNTGTEWISSSEMNPNIYVDMGSAQILTAAAVYWDSSTTTATQILVQTSPDGTTWTTVRTINTNLFTNGAWNYFRWDLPNTALPRYVRFYGNDGSAKVLAIWEIKIKVIAVTSAGIAAFISTHGHPLISSSVATTPLNA